MEPNISDTTDNNLVFISDQILSFVGISAFFTATFPFEMVRTRLQTYP